MKNIPDLDAKLQAPFHFTSRILYRLGSSSTQFSLSLPWSQRLSFILYWQILRRAPLLLFFLLARSAESREKKASGRDRWEPHFHAISF